MAKKKQKLKQLYQAKLPSIKRIVYPIAKFGSAPVAFIDQISAKDRQILGSAYDNAPFTQKLKILSNIIMGRTTGINPFSSEYKAPQTLNLAGVINKWTNIGVTGLAYSIIGKGVNRALGTKIAPAVPEIKQISRSLLIGGILGGVFDDPVGNPHKSTTVGTRQYSMSNMPTNTRMTSTSGSESAF